MTAVLEIVVYARGAERHELNVNTGELVHLDPDDDPAFWFVLDRSVAEQHSPSGARLAAARAAGR